MCMVLYVELAIAIASCRPTHQDDTYNYALDPHFFDFPINGTSGVTRQKWSVASPVHFFVRQAVASDYALADHYFYVQMKASCYDPMILIMANS